MKNNNNKMVNVNIKFMGEEKGYDMENLIKDRDKTLLESFISDYNSGYICDIMSKIADSQVEIYGHKLHENSICLKDYIDDLEFSMYDSLDNLFMAGEFEYNNAVLYSNLDELIFNKLIHLLEKNKYDIIKEIEESFNNINNGELFTVILNNDDIENIIDENNIDQEELLENLKDYIISYIIELIESREVGEIQDGSKKGKDLYIPFEIESFNKLKKFCKNGGLKPPTIDSRDEVYYVTNSLKDTYKVSKA